MPAAKTATITVTECCTCGATQWFRCEGSCPAWIVVAEYDAPAFDDIPSAPDPVAVAWVEAQHPGKSLRYLKAGYTFNSYLQTARERLQKAA